MSTRIVRNRRGWRRVRRRCIFDFVWRGRVVEIGAMVGSNGRQQVLRNALYHRFGRVARWMYENGRVMNHTQEIKSQGGLCTA